MLESTSFATRWDDKQTRPPRFLAAPHPYVTDCVKTIHCSARRSRRFVEVIEGYMARQSRTMMLIIKLADKASDKNEMSPSVSRLPVL